MSVDQKDTKAAKDAAEKQREDERLAKENFALARRSESRSFSAAAFDLEGGQSQSGRTKKAKQMNLRSLT